MVPGHSICNPVMLDVTIPAIENFADYFFILIETIQDINMISI